LRRNKLSLFSALFISFLSLNAQDEGCGNATVIISEDKPINWQYPEVLVLEDSFSGPQLDQNIWGFGFPWGRILVDDALEGMAEENLSFRDGKAIIKTEYRPRDFDRFIFENGQLIGTEPVPKDYSSAGFYSKIEFTRGSFELDYEIDAISAQWPAFWLLGDCQQELDIFEYFYGNSIFHDNWTKEISYSLHQDYNCVTPDKCRLTKAISLEDKFYEKPLYSALDWDFHQLRFYSKPEDADWIHYRWRDFSYRPIAYPKKGDILYQSRYFPFDRPMRILIGQGVHENIDKKIKEGARFFKIDHIRVWQKAIPNGKYKLDLNFDYNNEYDGIICAQKVELIDRSPFDHKEYLIVRALESVEIHSGFDSQTNFLDLKATTNSETRYNVGNSKFTLTPQNITGLQFFNLQGFLIHEVNGLFEPIHERDNLIQKERTSQKLEGIFIVKIKFSDGTQTILKLGFF